MLADFGFIISYSLLTLFSFKILFDALQLPVKGWVDLLPFITGSLDIIESLGSKNKIDFRYYIDIDGAYCTAIFFYFIIRGEAGKSINCCYLILTA